MLLLLDKTGSNETAKVEGEGRGRHAKSRLQFPYRQAVAARLNQQADNPQPGRVSEFGEATRGNIDVHPETIIISLDADCNYNSGYVVGMRLKDRKSAVASAPGAAGVRVWHRMSRGRGPWTQQPLPEVVRVAYPRELWVNEKGVSGSDAR